ncbi:MAG: class D sortase, partial [Acidimicrobiales bacterium]
MASAGACRVNQRPSGGHLPVLPAILSIPVIGLEAPVVQGTGDGVLSIAVGHDPGSVWPGQRGTSILLAHDASYFSRLGSLHTGNVVSWTDGCRRLLFRVNRVEVTRPGATLPQPANGTGLALVTCWPTDALFWTPDRLVVLASYVGAQPAAATAVPKPQALAIS